jgi:hypothetical protein
MSTTKRLAATGLALCTLMLSPSLSAQQVFEEGDSLPYYIHSSGAESRTDVRAESSYDGLGWTTEFRRSLQTGDATGDIQFMPGGTYSFQVTTWDNAGGGSHDLTDQAVVYTMTVPAMPGNLVFSSTPNVFTDLEGEYLNSGELTITVSWDDMTRNDQRKRWSFDGTDWNQSADNEDRVAFIWDMQDDGFASSGTCALMCHPPLMYTAPDTFVDTWHHKASRTGPAGFTDDKWWDDGAGGTANGRRSDTGQAVYSDNVSADHPRYQSTATSGPPPTFLFNGTDGMREAAPYSYGIWSEGDTLPGYVNRSGAGSRVDVLTDGTHDGSEWAATFRRKLDTGDTTGDIAFAAGGSYFFQVATFDNAGGAGHDTSDANNVYGMTIPAMPGDLTFSDTPSTLTSISGSLLDSGEIEITATWADVTFNAARKQWQYMNGVWVQSGENEDRLAIIWDMANDGFVSAGNCTMMCHPPLMYTAPGTTVDTWHYKASRTGLAGYTDDKWWDDGEGGSANGRRSDAGQSVYLDNEGLNGHPTFMSSAGASTSAVALMERPTAPGWTGVSIFGLRDGFASKGNLKVNFKKEDKDSLNLSGTFALNDQPLLTDGLKGTFRVGTLSVPFVMSSKGKSEKDTVVKVTLKTNKKGGKWTAKVKNVDLKDALGIVDETVAKPGVPLEIDWNLTLNNGWALEDPATVTYTANEGKSGKGKVVVE